MKIISVREHPDKVNAAIQYFQEKWASEESRMVYEDCMLSCLKSESPLPQWYLLYDGETVAGCAGLVTNDFISRMDLYPWLCALYIEKAYRGQRLASILMEQAKKTRNRRGFNTCI